jgi:hypothetical protein
MFKLRFYKNATYQFGLQSDNEQGNHIHINGRSTLEMQRTQAAWMEADAKKNTKLSCWAGLCGGTTTHSRRTVSLLTEVWRWSSVLSLVSRKWKAGKLGVGSEIPREKMAQLTEAGFARMGGS